MPTAGEGDGRLKAVALMADKAHTPCTGGLGSRVPADPLRWEVRGLLVLGARESAVYLVRSIDDELERLDFALTADFRALCPESLAKHPRISAEKVKLAHVLGHGGSYLLSGDEHRALIESGNFAEAMLDIARGLYPEEVVQLATGAEVRLHVNGV